MMNSHQNDVSLARRALRAALAGVAMASASCTPPTEESPGVALPGATDPGTPGGSASSTGTSAAAPGDSVGALDADGGVSEDNAGVGPDGFGSESTLGGPVALGSGTGTGGVVGADAGTAAGTGPVGAAVTGCWTTSAAGQMQLDQTDKIVLFDGTNMAAWRRETGGPAHWNLLPDGTMEVIPAEPPTDLQSNQTFEDLCVHVEYLTPTYPSNVIGQLRGNSGIYLKSAYEMQILDSIGKPPAIDSCGAVYSIQPPLAVACNQELVWNTYEIEFSASEWAGAMKTKNAEFVLVTLNGTVVQRNVPLNPNGGFTEAGNADRPGPQPLMLQDHRNRIKFRNIWVKVPH